MAINYGIEADMASWIFSAMGIANCIGRVFFGKLVDAIVSKYGDETVVYVCMAILTLNGLGILCWPKSVTSG